MLLKLALKDLFFDRLISSCQVAAIASILAPLLLLFSLRYGIVNELENKLLQDPTVLSLTLDSSAQLDSAFFDKLIQDPDVGFVIPEVSALSALVNLHFGNRVERVAVMATAPSDPIVVNSNISLESKSSTAVESQSSAAHTNNVTQSDEAVSTKSTSQIDSQESATSSLKQTEEQNAAQDEPQKDVSKRNQQANQTQSSQQSNQIESQGLNSSGENKQSAVEMVVNPNNAKAISSKALTASVIEQAEVLYAANNTNGTTDVAANGSVNNASITAQANDSENATDVNSELVKNEQNAEIFANSTIATDVNAAVANASPSNSDTVKADIGSSSNEANGSVNHASITITAPDNDSDSDKSWANALQDNEQVSKTAVVVLPEVANSIAEQSWLKGGLADNEALVTEDIACKYQIKTEDELKVVVSRTKNGQGETKNKTFKVKGIIKQRFVNDDFLAVNLNVLKAIDDYRVGLEPAIFSDGSNIRTTKRTYAKFRLFAKSIDSVIPLYNKLIKQGLNVSSKVGQIENIQAIARVLNFIFIVIALVSGIGGALALSGLMLSSLKSRKRNFVLLRLMGQSRRETYFLVLLENVMLSSLGFILAWAFYMAGSQVFNQYFGAMLPEAVISHLTVEHGLIFYLSTVLIAALLALWSAKYIFLKAHIADVLREA